MSASHASITSPTPLHNAVVISSRCSFETADAFLAVEHKLRAGHCEHAVRDIRRRPTKFESPAKPDGTPAFATAVKSPARLTLKTEAARSNDHTRTPYHPPNDLQHRTEAAPAMWKCPHEDFVAKFRLPSNQDLRRRTAIDQEDFFVDAGATLSAPSGAPHFVKSDEPGARSFRSSQQRKSAPALPCRPEFQSNVPHTTRKSSNIELRVEAIVDQKGLLPGLGDIREHNFREDALKTPDQVSFRAAFKAAPLLRPIGGDL